MKTPSQKLLLTTLVGVLGIAATLATPAFAQYREPSRHERTYAAPSEQQYNSDIPHYGDAPYDQRDDW